MATGKFIYKGKHRRFPSKEFLEERRKKVAQELGIEEYESIVGPGMFTSQRSKGKQKLSSLLTPQMFYVFVLICIPVAWVAYGEPALWVGGALLSLPLLIKYFGVLEYFESKRG
jgi:hypothetical protein